MLAAQKSVVVAPEVNLRNSQKGLINGRSRISKTVGEGAAPTTEEKVKTYFLTRFLLKTAWNWKKLDRGLVPRAPLSPPMLMFSKNVFKNSLKNVFFKKIIINAVRIIVLFFLNTPDTLIKLSTGIFCVSNNIPTPSGHSLDPLLLLFSITHGKENKEHWNWWTKSQRTT